MIISISQENINKGIRKNREKCPLSLALKERNFKDSFHVTIGYLYLLNGTGDKIDLPDEAVQFLCDFDNGKAVSPIEFFINYNP